MKELINESERKQNIVGFFNKKKQMVEVSRANLQWNSARFHSRGVAFVYFDFKGG